MFVDRIFSIIEKRRKRGSRDGCGISPFGRRHHQFSVYQGVEEPVGSKDGREIVPYRIFDVSHLSLS